jgi:hypothetical protein
MLPVFDQTLTAFEFGPAGQHNAYAKLFLTL